MSLRILFVDDEADVFTLIKYKFAKEIRQGDMTFFFAENGEEALKILRNNAPIHLVVTDIEMPRANGFTLLEAMSREFPHTKATVLSAYSDQERRQRASRFGASMFLTKPFCFSDIEKIFQNAHNRPSSITT
jgi:adenylate cyclase